MARRTLLTLLLAAWFAGSIVAAAQMAGAVKDQPKGQPASSGAKSITQVTLGRAVVPTTAFPVTYPAYWIESWFAFYPSFGILADLAHA